MITNKCPNCGSSDIKKSKHIGCALWVIIFISIGLGLIMIPFLPYKYKCKKCGTEWK